MTHLEMLCLALLLDAVLGEPDWLWQRMPHPVVLMGRAVETLDHALNRGGLRRVRGILAVLLLAMPALLFGGLLAALPDFGLIELVLAAVLLAQRSLSDHVGAVIDGLGLGLAGGRQAVAQIVGRDTEGLDEAGVARAAIETTAESFADGVVAPAFWFLLLGLPGILLLKLVNTADSMIGHRSERYLEFGWAAARLDDALNWIPARIAGALICLAGLRRAAWRIMEEDAGHHESPNAGWPEAAMAGTLDVALGGPRSYGGKVVELDWLNPDGRIAPGVADIRQARRVLWAAWGAMLAVLVLAMLFLNQL